jgi:hypothetical protein
MRRRVMVRMAMVMTRMGMGGMIVIAVIMSAMIVMLYHLDGYSRSPDPWRLLRQKGHVIMAASSGRK